MDSQFLGQIIDVYSQNKNLFELDFMYYINLALDNPTLGAQVLNNGYLQAVVQSLISEGNAQRLELATSYVKHVWSFLQDGTAKKGLKVAQVHNEAEKLLSSVKGKNAVLDETLKQVIEITK